MQRKQTQAFIANYKIMGVFFTAGSYLNNIYLLKILKFITVVYIRKLSIIPLFFPHSFLSWSLFFKGCTKN